MTHEEKMAMREYLYKHSMALMEKVKRMFDSGELTIEQMNFAGDIMKDLSSIDKNLSKACYYDSKHDTDENRKY